MDFTLAMVIFRAFLIRKTDARHTASKGLRGQKHITKNSLAGNPAPCYNGRISRQGLR